MCQETKKQIGQETKFSDKYVSLACQHMQVAFARILLIMFYENVICNYLPSQFGLVNPTKQLQVPFSLSLGSGLQIPLKAQSSESIQSAPPTVDNSENPSLLKGKHLY